MHINLKSFLISLYIWLFIVFSMVPLFVLFCVLWLLVFPFDRNNKVTHYYTMLWTRLYLSINPGWKVQVENREKLDGGKTFVLISNHQSIIDIALLLQLNINFKWVSKMELARVPFVGWVIWLNNHILVRRGDKQSVALMAETCKITLDGGVSVFMFPEGTRTGNGELQAFKEGAFILAKDNRVPIQPVVIDGASRALPRKGFWFRNSQTFTVRVLDKIPTEKVMQTEVAGLIEYTRDLMTEALENIRKSVPLRILRRMGFKADSQGIIDRYINVNGAWDDHLNHARSFILNALAGKPIRDLAVYGSGWLLDLPLDELSAMADRVWLYDVFHPPQVLHRIQKFSNVSAVAADITGGTLMAAYEAVKVNKKRGIKSLPEELCNMTFEPVVKPDFAISINILSQIGELITDYLQKHMPYSMDETDRMVCLLQQSHLKLLPPGASLLITDTEELSFDSEDQLIISKSLIRCSLPYTAPAEVWEWQFDPLMEYRSGVKTVFRVMAFKG